MKLHLNMYSNLQKSSQGPQLHIKTTKPQILYLLKPFTSQNSTKKEEKTGKHCNYRLTNNGQVSKINVKAFGSATKDVL